MDILEKKAWRVRKAIIGSLVPQVSHHIGCSLGIVELLVYLYFEELHIDPKKPQSTARDMFILSKGHAGISLFATLAERGFFPRAVLTGYDVEGGTLPEHVSMVVPGVELSTGSLGHGLPVACGMAYDFAVTKSSRRSVVILSDGEMDEGSNWEAIMFAGHHKLKNLIAIVDNNGFQGYGSTSEVLNISPLSEKVSAFGWDAYELDGHDFGAMRKIFGKIKASKSGKPSMLIAKTIKGKGIPVFEGKFESHYNSIDGELIKNILADMDAQEKK